MTKSLRCEASIIYRQGPNRLNNKILQKIKKIFLSPFLGNLSKIRMRKSFSFYIEETVFYASVIVFDLDFIVENFFQPSRTLSIESACVVVSSNRSFREKVMTQLPRFLRQMTNEIWITKIRLIPAEIRVIIRQTSKTN